MGQGLSAVFPIVVIRIVADLLMHLFLGIKIVQRVTGSSRNRISHERLDLKAKFVERASQVKPHRNKAMRQGQLCGRSRLAHITGGL